MKKFIIAIGIIAIVLVSAIILTSKSVTTTTALAPNADGLYSQVRVEEDIFGNLKTTTTYLTADEWIAALNK